MLVLPSGPRRDFDFKRRHLARAQNLKAETRLANGLAS